MVYMRFADHEPLVEPGDGVRIHRLDASSGFEAERAMRAGVPPDHIQLTTQELPANLRGLLDRGVLMNACSIAQLSGLSIDAVLSLDTVDFNGASEEIQDFFTGAPTKRK